MSRDLLIIHLVIDIIVHFILLWLSFGANAVWVLGIVFLLNCFVYLVFGVRVRTFLLVFSATIFCGIVFYSNYYKDANTILVAALTSLTCLYCFSLYDSFSVSKVPVKLSFGGKLEFCAKTILMNLIFMFAMLICVFRFDHPDLDDFWKMIIIAATVIIFVCNAIVTTDIIEHLKSPQNEN